MSKIRILSTAVAFPKTLVKNEDMTQFDQDVIELISLKIGIKQRYHTTKSEKLQILLY